MAAKKNQSREIALEKGRQFGLSIVIVHLYLEYVRPADIYTFLAPLRLGGIALIASIFVWWTKCKKDAFKDPLIKLYALLLIEMALYVPFAVNNHDAFLTTTTLFFILIGAVLPLIGFVNNYENLQRFFFHWVVMNFILCLVVVKNGGKGTGSFLADENDVGLAIAMAFPYPLYLSFFHECSKKKKLILRAVVLMMLAAGVYTRSRGALLGMTSVWFAIWIMSQHKLRNLSIFFAGALLLGGVVLNMLPAGYLDRMNTAADPNNDTRVERIYSWKIGWVMFLHNPVFGVGSGNYPWRVANYEGEVERPKNQPPLPGRVAHSFYFTLLPELGIFGAIIIGTIIIIVVRRLRWVVREASNKALGASRFAQLGLMAKAVLASLVGFLVSGTFISVVYYPHLWLVMSFSIIIYRVAILLLSEVSAVEKTTRRKAAVVL